MKVSITVTPLIALEPFDAVFEDTVTLGEIHNLIEQRVKNAVRDYLITVRGIMPQPHTVKWHESNVRWVSENSQDFMFTPRSDGK